MSVIFIQATGLPLMLSHPGMERVLGDAMGTFKHVDNSQEKGSVGTMLRFRATIDITKPLRRMIQITGPQGQEIQVHVAYERLPNFFYFCGIMGHLVKDSHHCLQFAGPTGDIPEDQFMYGDWLRTHANVQQAKYDNGSLNRSHQYSANFGQFSQSSADTHAMDRFANSFVAGTSQIFNSKSMEDAQRI